jgi:hypothetical protein
MDNKNSNYKLFLDLVKADMQITRDAFYAKDDPDFDNTSIETVDDLFHMWDYTKEDVRQYIIDIAVAGAQTNCIPEYCAWDDGSIEDSDGTIHTYAQVARAIRKLKLN